MYTIIVVDDEEELRHAIIKRVEWEKIGFEVVGEAGNGIDALELVEQLEPDLLLTDIRMPFMSGIELARQVREVRPATQIAFLSGYDDFAYAQQAIQYNIISYLLKPISMADLTASIISRCIDGCLFESLLLLLMAFVGQGARGCTLLYLLFSVTALTNVSTNSLPI